MPSESVSAAECGRDSPSMSSLCMMMASSTSLGMYPRDRMAIPSSCLEMNPFPSRSSTLNASRISAKTNNKSTHNQWATLIFLLQGCRGEKVFFQLIYLWISYFVLCILGFLFCSSPLALCSLSFLPDPASCYAIGLAPLPQVNKINSSHWFIFYTCFRSRRLLWSGFHSWPLLSCFFCSTHWVTFTEHFLTFQVANHPTLQRRVGFFSLGIQSVTALSIWASENLDFLSLKAFRE